MVVDYETETSDRIITIFDVDSMKIIRQRTYEYSSYRVKSECHNGIIIVPMVRERHSYRLANWNVAEDTVQLTTELPYLTYRNNIGLTIADGTLPTRPISRLYTAAVDYSPSYQCVLVKCEDGHYFFNTYLIKDRERNKRPFLLVGGMKFLPSYKSVVNLEIQVLFRWFAIYLDSR